MKKRIIYSVTAIIFIAVCLILLGFVIDFTEGNMIINVLLSIVAWLSACGFTYMGNCLINKGEQWSKKKWLTQMILPTLFTLVFIMYK